MDTASPLEVGWVITSIAGLSVAVRALVIAIKVIFAQKQAKKNGILRMIAWQGLRTEAKRVIVHLSLGASGIIAMWLPTRHNEYAIGAAAIAILLVLVNVVMTVNTVWDEIDRFRQLDYLERHESGNRRNGDQPSSGGLDTSGEGAGGHGEAGTTRSGGLGADHAGPTLGSGDY